MEWTAWEAKVSQTPNQTGCKFGSYGRKSSRKYNNLPKIGTQKNYVI